MKLKGLFTFIALSFCVFVLQPIVPANADTLELVSLLTKNLGITEKQATGGAGALFNLAKNSLGKKDFRKVSDAVPGIDTLIKAAPKIGKLGGVGEMVSSLGGSSSKLLAAASLVPQFSKLGMGEGMIKKFIPPILSFTKSRGGETVMNLLEGVWK